MERKGSCLMCGDCCKHVGWFDIGDNYQMLEYLEAIGNIIIEKNNSGYKVCVPHICQHLKKTKDNKFICTLHHDQKPIECKNWPENTSQLERHPNCGYYFEERKV